MTAGSDSTQIQTQIQVTVRGDVHDEERAYALNKIGSVLSWAHAPVLSAHLVLGRERDPAQPHRAHLEVGLDVNGVPVRAHIAAESISEGADLLQDRLRRRLVQLRDRTRDRHRSSDAAYEFGWRSDERSRQAPEPRQRSSAQEVVRRKTFALRPLTADDAVYEMELLDHDFYLYTDESGAEAVVSRGQDGTHPVLTSAPVLTESQAIERLELAGEPFVFYRDPVSGRGLVVYRRFDGHYGLIMSS